MFGTQKPCWKPVHANVVITSLERGVFDDLGAQIDEAMVLATLRMVEERGAIEIAHRLRQRISSIDKYGKSKKCVSHSPAEHLGEAMQNKPKAQLRPAVVSIKGARKIGVPIRTGGPNLGGSIVTAGGVVFIAAAAATATATDQYLRAFDSA